MRPVFHLIIGLLLLAGTPVLPLATQPVQPGPLPAPSPAPVSPATVTAMVYVYEKDAGPVPPGVAAGLDRINREKRVPGTLFEQDTVDGTGKTPEQYRVPLKAARDASLPALIVMSGTTVAKTVKAPKTAEDVLKAFP